MATATPRGRRTSSKVGEALGNWLFLLPAVAFFMLWQVWPIVQVAWISLTDFRYTDLSSPVNSLGLPTNFVGFQNYSKVLRDDLMWEGLKRALIFTTLFVPGMILIPMVIATLIDRVTSNKLATFYRLILLIPSMIPGPLIFVLWRWMYMQYTGPINYVLVDVLHLYYDSQLPAVAGRSASRLLFPRLHGMVVGAWLPHDVLPGGHGDDSEGSHRCRPLDGASEFRLWRNIVVPGCCRSFSCWSCSASAPPWR